MQTPEATKSRLRHCSPPLRPHRVPSAEPAPHPVPRLSLHTPRYRLPPNNSPTHHDPEGGRHLGQGVGVVGGDRGDPCAPQQGEEPRRVDRVEVHAQVPGRVVPAGQADRGCQPSEWGLGPSWDASGACPPLETALLQRSLEKGLSIPEDQAQTKPTSARCSQPLLFDPRASASGPRVSRAGHLSSWRDS